MCYVKSGGGLATFHPKYVSIFLSLGRDDNVRKVATSIMLQAALYVMRTRQLNIISTNFKCGVTFNDPTKVLNGGCCDHKIQSTLVISNSKGLIEMLRDIRTLTYQICRIEEKIIRTTTFDNICDWTLEVRDILKILWKRGEIAISPLFHNIFYLLLDFHIYAGTIFSLRDKWLFEINQVEITRVNCNLKAGPYGYTEQYKS